MTDQIGHRELVGAIAGTCGVSAPPRAPTARKCTVRTTLAPSAQTALLGGPFGHAEQAIRHHQDEENLKATNFEKGEWGDVPISLDINYGMVAERSQRPSTPRLRR